jgi:putative hydrolase of the HAD superfamily
MNTNKELQPRCIVFDLDDTLYLEKDYVRSGFSQVGMLVDQQFGIRGFYDAAWRLFQEGQRRNIFDQALRAIGIPIEGPLIKELISCYRNHVPAITLADDAVKCLDSLRSTYKLALITDGPVPSQENKIRVLDVARWIPLRVLTGLWGAEFSKPHPRAFITVQDQMGVSRSECVYVADNPTKDFASPASLGWATVRVRREQGLYSQVASESCFPNYEIKDLTSLQEMLFTK